MRTYISGILYTEEEFKDIQTNFNGRAEYDNGIIYLSPNTSKKHDVIVNNINLFLSPHFKRKQYRLYTDTEVIFKGGNDVKKFKPDIFVMSYGSDAPKIIFEIFSESTYKFKKAKHHTYEKYGVLEYNVVDLNGIIVQYTLINSSYEITNNFKKGDKYISSIFKDLIIDIDLIFS